MWPWRLFIWYQGAARTSILRVRSSLKTPLMVIVSNVSNMSEIGTLSASEHSTTFVMFMSSLISDHLIAYCPSAYIVVNGTPKSCWLCRRWHLEPNSWGIGHRYERGTTTAQKMSGIFDLMGRMERASTKAYTSLPVCRWSTVGKMNNSIHFESGSKQSSTNIKRAFTQEMCY